MTIMATIEIAGRHVGNGAPCFITFEAGPTHQGAESAKRLASMAAEAKADAIKFQILDPDRLVSDRKQLFQYEILVDRQTGRREKVEEPLYDLLARRALSPEKWHEVKAHCDDLGLAFFATIGFEDEVDFVHSLGCHSIKIASADVNHEPLLKRAGETGLNIQLDTGNSTLGEIEQAVDVLGAAGCRNIIIHHCPSGYPAHLEGINLNVIRTLKSMFPFPIAYSDHSPGWEMDIAAVAIGAAVVEKTITEDRTAPSIEHIMSLEPPEMTRFVSAIRDLETALGSFRRVVTTEERERRLANRRSIHVKSDLPAGHELGMEDFEYRRPGIGIPPSAAFDLAGRALARPLAGGKRLEWTDLVPIGDH